MNKMFYSHHLKRVSSININVLLSGREIDLPWEEGCRLRNIDMLRRPPNSRLLRTVSEVGSGNATP